ncbi:MAG: hypothetical protein Kow0081_0690 [Candidatus Dojkabacteria bacterium]
MLLLFMKLIAFIVKGLSEICAKEIQSLSSTSILLEGEKYIIFDYIGDFSSLEKLKTVDDVAILILE